MGTWATWNTTNGDWFSAQNWNEPNPNGSNVPLHYVPTVGNDAVFNGSGAYIVTYNGVDSVDGILFLNGGQLTLNMGGGSLTIGADGAALAQLSTSSGATFALGDKAFVGIAGDIVNAGAIKLNAVGDPTRLTIGLQTTLSPVSLTGGGAITLSDSANNQIFIDNAASIDNVDNTISGAGAITSNFTSLTNGTKGVIDATGASNGLVLAVPNVTNLGLIEDTGVGGLQLFDNGLGSSIDNQGGTIAATGAGAHVDIGNGTLIAGGSLRSSGGGVIQVTNNANGNILDGATDGAVTITAGSTLRLNDGSALELTGTSATAGVIVNDGTISLVAGADRTALSGHGGGTTRLTGGGQMTLSDSADNFIGGGDFGTVFDNVNNTISGAGVIDSVAGRMSLTNETQGVIEATGANNALSVQNIVVTNSGLLEDTGAGGLSLAGVYVTNVGGTIAAKGASAHVDLIDNGIGATTIEGGTLATSGGGVIKIASSAATLKGSVKVAGAVAGAGTLAVASGDTTFASGAALTTSNFSIAGGAEAEIATSLTYAGAIDDAGTVTLDSGGTLTLSGAISGSGAIDFAGGVATLSVDVSTLGETVSGFALGDTIDFATVAFAASDFVTYVRNGAGTGGTVTVETSSKAAIASFVVTGVYTPSRFTLSDDGGHVAVVGAARSTPSDFNGDGVSDILWRDPVSGADTIWDLTPSGGRTAVNPGTVPASSEVAGIGDFNHDGISDILWRNTTTGADSIWDMTASGGHTTVNPGTVATSYEVAGVGDFNGDGIADILWRNTSTGADSIWDMTPSGGRTAVNPGTVASSYVVAGVGDFNGDGIADILWRNTTTGADSIWDMSASGGHTAVNPGTVATTYEVAGVGDFNGDGIADILWRNTTTGADSLWDMTASGGRTVVNPGTVATNYVVASVGDFNGDGVSDILWRDPSTGADSIWDMNASGGHTTVNPGTVASNWKVAT